MNKQEILEQLRKFKEDNYLKYEITAFGIFGSVARGQDNPKSDLDIFIKIQTPNPFILVHIKEELEKLFNTHVDIVRLRENMNSFLKNRIDKEGINV